MTNQVTLRFASDLRKASSANEAPIWRKLAEMALKPRSSKREVNLNKISRVTKEGDVVVVPGKVLGTGAISHKVTVCSFSISNIAASKIIEAGGSVVSHSELIKKHPTGKGVKIIG